jgi:hypothetical protein
MICNLLSGFWQARSVILLSLPNSKARVETLSVTLHTSCHPIFTSGRFWTIDFRFSSLPHRYVDYIPPHGKTGDELLAKDLVGGCRGLIEELPRHLPARTEGNHKKKKDSRCSRRDANQAPPGKFTQSNCFYIVVCRPVVRQRP